LTPPPLSSNPLFAQMESNSSINTIHGASFFADENMSRIFFSVSPKYFENISGLE
jgi:hypothetical protein